MCNCLFSVRSNTDAADSNLSVDKVGLRKVGSGYRLLIIESHL